MKATRIKEMPKTKTFPDMKKLTKATMPSKEETRKINRAWNAPSTYLKDFQAAQRTLQKVAGAANG